MSQLAAIFGVDENGAARLWLRTARRHPGTGEAIICIPISEMGAYMWYIVWQDCP